MVLEEGVLEGRKVFANILKYVRMGASSNFGNMFSVLGASAFAAVPADGADPDPDQQPALRLLAGADPDRQRRPRADRQAAPLVDAARSAGSCCSSARSARSSTTRPTSSCVRVRLLRTPAKRVPVPDRLVRRVAADADAHHPRHPHARIPFVESRASLPLTLTTLTICTIGWWLPLLPTGAVAGLHTVAGRLLGDSRVHPGELPDAHALREGLRCTAASVGSSDSRRLRPACLAGSR